MEVLIMIIVQVVSDIWFEKLKKSRTAEDEFNSAPVKTFCGSEENNNLNFEASV